MAGKSCEEEKSRKSWWEARAGKRKVREKIVPTIKFDKIKRGAE